MLKIAFIAVSAACLVSTLLAEPDSNYLSFILFGDWGTGTASILTHLEPSVTQKYAYRPCRAKGCCRSSILTHLAFYLIFKIYLSRWGQLLFQRKLNFSSL